MQMQYRKLSELEKLEDNPRLISKDSFEKLCDSIKNNKDYFEARPIILSDRTGKLVIIAGNQRYEAAKKIGMDEVPTFVLKGLDEAREKEINIRDNINNGTFNWDLLANNFDFGELVDFGFEVREVEKLFDIVKEDEFDVGEELKKIVEPKVTYGDHWRLGRHRLVCGDATKEDDLANLMVAERARLIFTDPPYNVDYDYTLGTGKKNFNDKKTDDDYYQLLFKSMKNLFEYASDDCSIYWWHSPKYDYLIKKAFKDSGWRASQTIIWLKNSPIFSRGFDYHLCYEPCQFGWKDKKKHFRNNIGNYKDVFSLSIQDFSELLDVWYEHRDQTTAYIHPTQKPVRLAERAIKKNSEQNDLVVDVFGGSGSTLMACEQMNRRCNIMELDPKFSHAILNRWSQFTGDDPVRSDGRRWSEVSKNE